jgi:hypothetical protein
MTSSVDGGELLASRPRRFTPEDRAPDSHSIGVWVDPRVGLEAVERRRIFPHRDSNSYPLAVQPVAIPTALWKEMDVKIGVWGGE